MSAPESGLPIHDLWVKPLEWRSAADHQRLRLLAYGDHILRRFGFAELVSMEPGTTLAPIHREVADEAWALTSGTAVFQWEDLREVSPTAGARFELRCDRPTVVLVPFGVSFTVAAQQVPVHLLRLATHEELQPEDLQAGQGWER